MLTLLTRTAFVALLTLAIPACGDSAPQTPSQPVGTTPSRYYSDPRPCDAHLKRGREALVIDFNQNLGLDAQTWQIKTSEGDFSYGFYGDGKQTYTRMLSAVVRCTREGATVLAHSAPEMRYDRTTRKLSAVPATDDQCGELSQLAHDRAIKALEESYPKSRSYVPSDLAVCLRVKDDTPGIDKLYLRGLTVHAGSQDVDRELRCQLEWNRATQTIDYARCEADSPYFPYP